MPLIDPLPRVRQEQKAFADYLSAGGELTPLAKLWVSDWMAEEVLLLEEKAR